MTEKALHETENYVVLPGTVDDFEDAIFIEGVTYYDFYEVVNRDTGIIEFRSPAFPVAMNVAEQFNSMIATKSWEFFRPSEKDANEIERALAEDGSEGLH